ALLGFGLAGALFQEAARPMPLDGGVVYHEYRCHDSRLLGQGLGKGGGLPLCRRLGAATGAPWASAASAGNRRAISRSRVAQAAAAPCRLPCRPIVSSRSAATQAARAPKVPREPLSV